MIESLAEIDVSRWEDAVAAPKLEDFEIIRCIGKGSQSQVYLSRGKCGQTYTLKVMQKNTACKLDVNLQLEQIVSSIRCPFVAASESAFQTNQNLYLVSKFCGGGELSFHLRSRPFFRESWVRFYAAEIAVALQQLHRNSIIHRDLKLENVLLDKEGHISVIDFGLAADISGSKLAVTVCGTPESMAPEVILQSKLGRCGYGTAVDWWSLGCMIFEMLTGRSPFSAGGNARKVLANVLQKQPEYPLFMSANARSLVEGLLTKNYRNRLQGDSVFRHPFFESVDWEAIERKEAAVPFLPMLDSDVDTRNFESKLDYDPEWRSSDSDVGSCDTFDKCKCDW